MKLRLLSFCFAMGSLAFAEEDLSKSDSKGEGPSQPMSALEICDRLEVLAEGYKLSSDGKTILGKLAETRKERPSRLLATKDQQNYACRFGSRWGSSSEDFEGMIALESEWTVDLQGKIKGRIAQYADVGDKRGEFKNLLKETEFDLTDMSSLSWPSVVNHGVRIVFRFTPSISDSQSAKNLTYLPISGQNIVAYDNLGNLWASNFSFDNKYIAARTFRGTIMLSFYPFKGAKILGTAQDHSIKLSLDSKTILTIKSEVPFLPALAHANVYGIFDPRTKTERVSSQRIFTSDTEEKLLQKVNMK